MRRIRKRLIGIPARHLQYISNGAGGNPIYILRLFPDINVGVINHILEITENNLPRPSGRGL